MAQSNGNTVFIKPSILVENEKNVTIHYNIINITALGGKNSIAGYGTYPIQTEFFSYQETSGINNISNISINTSYVNAWHSFFNNTLIKAGLNYAGYGTNYSINTTDEEILIDFHETITVNVNVRFIEIGAQISPGWIERR